MLFKSPVKILKAFCPAIGYMWVASGYGGYGIGNDRVSV